MAKSFLEAAEMYCEVRGDVADFRELYRSFRESRTVVDSVWNAISCLYGTYVADVLEEINQYHNPTKELR